MPTPKLPRTSVRLATSASFFVLREDVVSLSAIFQGIFQPRVVINEVQKEMKRVDGITTFNERSERGTSSRWEIDSNLPGEPLDALIQPVNRTFDIRRPVLYNSDIIKVFGFEDEFSRGGTVDADILVQQLRTPFIFIKAERAPENSGLPTITTFYRGCAFSSLSRSYNVENNNIIVYEDASIRYAGRQQFKS